MLVELIRQDQIANDLANASTPGYKPDRTSQRSFGELLLHNTATGAPVGSVSLGAGLDSVHTDLSQGPLRETGEPLDLALVGPGFLAVQTPAGVRYTRNGQLALDAQGRLVTSTGLPVLDAASRPIAVAGGEDMAVSADGTVRAGGRVAGKLALVSLTGAQKVGDSLFTGTPAADAGATEVRPGWLEGSGIDAARAMIDMIASLRAFESNQRVIRTIDETLGRGISAGSTGGG